MEHATLDSIHRRSRSIHVLGGEKSVKIQYAGNEHVRERSPTLPGRVDTAHVYPNSPVGAAREREQHAHQNCGVGS